MGRKIRLIPLIGDKEMRTDYSIAMAVRYREPKWKKMVEKFISRDNRTLMKSLVGMVFLLLWLMGQW